MNNSQIDLKGQLKAFPYVRPYVLDPGELPAEEAVNLQDFIDSLSGAVSQIPDDITDLIGLGEPPGAGIVGTDEWKSASVGDIGFIQDIVKGLDKTVEGINKIVTVLGKILKIIELFLTSFNSFSKIVLSAINLAQAKVNEYADDTFKAGVFTNVIAPPALLAKLSGDIGSMNELRGGFEAFLTRLESSVENPKDVERPLFKVNDFVGGLVIMTDTESLPNLWKTLEQMAAMFDFMGGFGLNMRPPPPANTQAFCGFFTDPEAEDPEEKKYGVQIEWDQTYTATGFNLYRSRIPGGTTKVEEYIPRTLQDDKETGEPGLLSLIRTLLLNVFRSDENDEPFVLPEREVRVYDDPDFNGGDPVYIKAGVSPSLKYTDFEIKTEKVVVEGTELDIPYIDEDGQHIPITNYYYIIKSCGVTGGLEGPDSKEIVVALKSCNDAFKLSQVVSQPNGSFEFFSAGFGKVNSWSSIQLNSVIPWWGEAIKIMNKILDSLKGMVTGASDSFSKFLKQIQGKIQMYVNLLAIVVWFIEQLKNFLLGPSISFLNIPPAKGGMPVFLERIRGAQTPEGGFSGPFGITVGVVLVYGASGTQMLALMAMKKAFEFIEKFFTD